MFVIVRKCPDKNLQNSALFPSDLARQLGLTPGQTYTLALGHRHTSLQVEVEPRPGNHLYLSRDIFSQLLCYTDLTVQIKSDQSLITLGPVIGVFVSPRFITDIAQQLAPVSAMEVAKANSYANTFLYYFTIDRINWLEGCVKGYVYLPEAAVKKWHYYWVPLPDVIYDRGVHFEPQERALVNHIREQTRLAPKKITRINSQDSLGKWSAHRALVKERSLHSFLPATCRHRQPQDLLEMLGKHGAVYLKSYYGSLGRDVVKITQDAAGITYGYNKWGTITAGHLATTDSLAQFVTDFFAGKSFVIQQAIDLYQIEGRPIDLRVLIQKNSTGQWQVTVIEVRMGAVQSPTTNVAGGGDLFYFEGVFPQELGLRKAQRLRQAIERVSLKLVQALEHHLGPMGEIGLDLAVAENLGIWYLEANAKPDKDPEPWAPGGISSGFLNTLEYAKYLANFSTAPGTGEGPR